MDRVLKEVDLERKDLDFRCPSNIRDKIADQLIDNSAWYIVGRALNVSHNKLKSIRQGDQSSPDVKAVDALDAWDEEKGSGATCLKLAEALHDHKKTTTLEILCQEVNRKIKSESATTPGPNTSTAISLRPLINPWQQEDLLGSNPMFTKEQKKKIEDSCGNSHNMLYRFQKLFSSTRESLKEKEVPVSELVHHLECLGSIKPTYTDTGLGPLRHQIPKLANAESVDAVMSVVKDYCSFFNYQMIEHIIDKLGTKQDKNNLEEYKKEFKSYAENCVIRCSMKVGEMIREGHAYMYVTLDDSFDDCALSHLIVFRGNLREVLNIPSDRELYLFHIIIGSIKLVFQLSLFIQQTIFPLSSEQEEALSGLDVVLLSCGDYQFIRYDSEPRSKRAKLALPPLHDVQDPTTDGDSKHTDSEGSVDSTKSKSDVLETLSIAGAQPDLSKPRISFPYLDLASMNHEEKESLSQRLFAESKEIIYKYEELFDNTRKSLVVRWISVDDLLKYLGCIGSAKPMFHGSDLPVFSCHLPELRKTESVDKAMSVIRSYCSFFNYRIVEEIVNNLGTERDKTNLKNYQEEFSVYAQRRVFECPSELGTMSEVGFPNMFITLDLTYNDYILTHVDAFVSKLANIFGIPTASFRLCSICPGSVKLTLQLPLSFKQAIIPLFDEQKKSSN